jgi:hypothetical protein
MRVLYADSESRIMEIEHLSSSTKIVSTRCIATFAEVEPKPRRLTLQGDAQLATFESSQDLCFLRLGEPMLPASGTKCVGRMKLLPERMRMDCGYKIMGMDRQMYLCHISSEGHLVMRRVAYSDSQPTWEKAIGSKKIKESSSFYVAEEEGRVTVSYLTSSNELVLLEKKGDSE